MKNATLKAELGCHTYDDYYIPKYSLHSSVLQPHSISVHIYIANFREINPLVHLRNLALLTISLSEKLDILSTARTLLQDALQSHPSTAEVKIGSYVSWSHSGLFLNFFNERSRWRALDDPTWLRSISPSLHFREHWSVIVISRIKDGHGTTSTSLAHLPAFVARCYQLNRLPYGEM